MFTLIIIFIIALMKIIAINTFKHKNNLNEMFKTTLFNGQLIGTGNIRLWTYGT